MKSYFTTAVGFGILSALQSFTAVNAQVQQNDLLKITVTGTRSEETVKDYAGSVDVITKDDLKYKPKSDLREVFDEIQRSNMSKLDADGQPIFREDGKVMKGENYFKPNIKLILEKHGILQDK